MSKKNLKASDLRAILEYVRLYRNQIFVIAIDGSVVACENFSDLITDIAVLKSLGINIVIVHGIGRQIKVLSQSRGVVISDCYGNCPVDDDTLLLAREASAMVSHKIREELDKNELKCVITNGVRATEVGILSGINYLNAGCIDKIDIDSLKNLLSLGMIPVLSPLAVNREGRLFRLNSDELASELAVALKASKLIFMTVTNGFAIGDEKSLAVPLHRLQDMVENRREELDSRVFDKAKYSAKALSSGFTPRAHILDGREFSSLLTEIFEKVGSGTMIYSDDYQKIRKATVDDVHNIYTISNISSKEQNLVQRSLDDIDSKIDTYYVYEVDGSIIAFVSLLDLGDGNAELASLHVQPFYQGNDVGVKMVEYVIARARERKYKILFALSTKSAPFFTEVCHFREVSYEELPTNRRSKYIESGRNSKILKKVL